MSKTSTNDGYKEMEARTEKPKKRSSNDIFTKRRLEKQREVDEVRKEEQDMKKPSSRSFKTVHPRGSGKRSIGGFR